jgi:hypothetical protein
VRFCSRLAAPLRLPVGAFRGPEASIYLVYLRPEPRLWDAERDSPGPPTLMKVAHDSTLNFIDRRAI